MLREKQIYQILMLLVFITIYGLSTIYAADTAMENSKTEVSLSVDSASQADIPATKGSKVIYEIIAYYFHGTNRCETCLSIEKQSKVNFEKRLPSNYKNIRFKFVSLNIEEEKNKHFAKDYQLVSSSLIVSLIKNSKQVKWKNLEGVWEYAHTPEKFDEYIKNEVAVIFKETTP